MKHDLRITYLFLALDYRGRSVPDLVHELLNETTSPSKRILIQQKWIEILEVPLKDYFLNFGSALSRFLSSGRRVEQVLILQVFYGQNRIC